MNKVLLGQPVEETFAGIENNQEETAQELTLEQLSRAVGENALLQTEVSRQMALKLVELRDEIRIARTEIGRLQGQIEHFVGGVCSALEISAIETSHRAEHVCVTRPPIVPRLLNTQKLLRMGAEIRLNVGCGCARPAVQSWRPDGNLRGTRHRALHRRGIERDAFALLAWPVENRRRAAPNGA
jgi:hypothetical protein